MAALPTPATHTARNATRRATKERAAKTVIDRLDLAKRRASEQAEARRQRVAQAEAKLAEEQARPAGEDQAELAAAAYAEAVGAAEAALAERLPHAEEDSWSEWRAPEFPEQSASRRDTSRPESRPRSGGSLLYPESGSWELAAALAPQSPVGGGEAASVQQQSRATSAASATDRYQSSRNYNAALPPPDVATAESRAPSAASTVER